MQDVQQSAGALPQHAEAPLARRERTWPIWTVAALLCVGMFVYAMIRAFVWDEGFHLVAAQLILAGKKPYIDFCFPQTPLNAYWNAAWMLLFGQSWRVSHIPAALELDAAILLFTHYLLSRFPVSLWRIPCVLAGMLFFGANLVLVEFGPVAQAYAICVLLGFAAYLLTLSAARRAGLWRAFLAGLASGAGTASSLLLAPILPVLLLWLWLKNERGSRIAKAVAFMAGLLPPFLPVLWLFVQSPHATFFNVVQYQAIFRRADWSAPLAAGHDFVVLTAWVDGGQTLLLLMFILVAILYVRQNLGLPKNLRDEFWLACWLSTALVLYISTAHPTFSRYYIVGMPLYALLAAPGLMVVGSRLLSPQRPFWPTALLVLVLLLSLGRALFDERDGATWQRYEEISREVAKVTPSGAKLFADEHVYFLLRRQPPSGLEFSYSHKVDLPPKEAERLHIIPTKELAAQMKAGVYATVETCDDDKIDDWHLAELYKQRKDVADCSIFWQFKKRK
ncbi:MAG TPA: hypothetical protein VH351_18450 [Bryobacteraceae bacterium]|nr:hypothetical protein [Bryobacteraceae bacterium]